MSFATEYVEKQRKTVQEAHKSTASSLRCARRRAYDERTVSSMIAGFIALLPDGVSHTFSGNFVILSAHENDHAILIVGTIERRFGVRPSIKHDGVSLDYRFNIPHFFIDYDNGWSEIQILVANYGSKCEVIETKDEVRKKITKVRCGDKDILVNG